MQQSDDKQRVLDATDIVRLVGDHLALRPRGREFVGLCPFHDDHKPSMNVVPHKQIYHCFSCGAGGNAFAFVMNYHKMTFREALQYLADRAGIQLTQLHSARSSSPEQAENSCGFAKADLLSATKTACAFFQTILAHAEHGRLARESIQRRGISPEMAELFQLGAAPDKWDGLSLTIGAKQMDVEPFRAVGLLKARDAAGSGNSGGGLYDAFRNRLIFPIHDQIGRVIGFGGRRLNDEEEPKYLNSPESVLFDKGSTLYGLHQAAQAIRQSRTALVTEGYTDTIACHQAGIQNAVATLGTAMTAGNARILRRLCDTVVLLFDGDEAGQKAAERAVEVFFSEPVDVKIATLSTGTDAKDPDELLKREGGAEILRSIIAKATDPLELLFARVRRSIDGQGLSARTRTIEEFVAKLVDLGIARVEPVRRRLIIQKLGQIAGVDWETIAQLIGERQSRQAGRAPRLALATPTDDEESRWRPTAGDHLLGCLMCDPSLMLSLSDTQCDVLDPAAYPEGPSRAIAVAVAELCASQEQSTLTRVLAIVDDPAAQRRATRLATEVDRVTDSDTQRLRLHWAERLAQARQDLARRPVQAPSNGKQTEPDECWDIALIRLRRQREAVGHDPRLVPRPLS